MSAAWDAEWDGIAYRVTFWVGIGLGRTITVKAPSLDLAWVKAVTEADRRACASGTEAPVAWTLIPKSFEAIGPAWLRKKLKYHSETKL